MVVNQPLISDFTVVGKLRKIVTKGKKSIKRLQLVTDRGKLWLKVTKELRQQLNLDRVRLNPGCYLQVSGIRQHHSNQNKITYKAYQIRFMASKKKSKTANQEAKSKAKVLFCQKSTCWKKGGKAACKALKAELKNRGLNKQVEIKTTGCLKQCGKAPNMIMMPDKARYSKVGQKQMTKLIDKHLVICS